MKTHKASPKIPQGPSINVPALKKNDIYIFDEW